MLNKNSTAPNFTAFTHDGEEITLSKIDADLVVLYFYPKDMTPGCTLEAKGINDNLDFFEKNKLKVFGVSRDNLKSHKKFVESCSLNFPLIVDDEKKICTLYDVLIEKSMFGKKYMGVTRTTYIVNPKEMKIVDVIEKVNPATHVETLKKLISNR